MIYDIIIIGGGTSGLAAAVNATLENKNAKICILERLDRIGKKILVTGNGRCNLLNSGDLIYNGNTNFALSVLGKNTVEELHDFFAELGLSMRCDNENRFYPAGEHASIVIDIFRLFLDQHHNIEVKTSEKVVKIIKTNNIFNIQTEANKYLAKNVIVCAGGAAAPKHGTDGTAYKLLTQLGHKKTKIMPALVPISTEIESLKGLSGIRVKADLRIDNNFRTGEILFAKYGISGIPAMQLSRFAKNGDTLHIDLRPAAMLQNINVNEIFMTINKRIEKYKNQEAAELLTGLFVKRIGQALLRKADVQPMTMPCEKITEKQSKAIANAIVDFQLKIKGTLGFDMAQVTAGGMECSEFDYKTMQSKLVKNLYVCGEILDVDGDCGGYNLMFAFKSGMSAGKDAVKNI